jgi:hypothetical protein
VLTAHPDAVHGLCWLEGQGGSEGLLLSGSEKGLVMAHDIRAPSPAWTLDLSQHSILAGGGEGICCMTAVPSSKYNSDDNLDGSLVVAGCTGGFVCLIDVLQRRISAINKPHTDDVRSISMFDSIKKGRNTGQSSRFFSLVTTSFDGIGALWTVNGGIDGSGGSLSWSFQLDGMMKGHSDKVLGVTTRSSGTGIFDVLTTGADGKAILWKQPVTRSYFK